KLGPQPDANRTRISQLTRRIPPDGLPARRADMTLTSSEGAAAPLPVTAQDFAAGWGAGEPPGVWADGRAQGTHAGVAHGDLHGRGVARRGSHGIAVAQIRVG